MVLEFAFKFVARPTYEPQGAAEEVDAAGRSSMNLPQGTRSSSNHHGAAEEVDAAGRSSMNLPHGTRSSSNHHAEEVDAAGRSSKNLGEVFLDRVRLVGLPDTVKFEMMKIREGGRKNIFKKKFKAIEGEKLLKASCCCLSIEDGYVAGILFISTERIAFCSQRSITNNFPIAQIDESLEQIKIPLRSIKRNNLGNPQQKNILIRTEDNSEFLFTGFLRYKKARQNLEKAMENGQAR